MKPIASFSKNLNVIAPTLSFPKASTITPSLNPKLQITFYSLFSISPGFSLYLGADLTSNKGCTLLYNYRLFYGLNFVITVDPITVDLPVVGKYEFTFGGMLPYYFPFPVWGKTYMGAPQYEKCLGKVSASGINSKKRTTPLPGFGVESSYSGNNSYNVTQSKKFFFLEFHIDVFLYRFLLIL